MFIGAIATVGGGLLSAYTSSKDRKAMEAANKANAPDPRIAETIFGKGGSGGLLDGYQNLGKAPQSAGLLEYGTGQDNYLKQFGGEDAQRMRNTAGHLMGSNIAAPQAGNTAIGAPAWAVGNMVDAPKQNGMDLSGSYDRFINGDAGANPYLTKALQGGIDQSTNQFKQMQGAATENLMENIMPSIRSNSVLAGQYGGSRQGIAEGNAIGDFAKAQQQAMTQFGQNNTNAAVGAQAQSFNQGQDRALSATQGLGAQQYGVAQQNAQTKNAAEFANVGQVLDIRKSQAGMDQQINLANLGAQQNNNQLNSVNQATGIDAGRGLLSQTYGAAQGQDNYALNKAGQVNSLLQPYLTNQGGPQQQPLTQNTAGNIAGGAGMGLALYNQFKGSGSGTGMPTPPLYNANYQPSKLPINTGLLQNFDFMNQKG